MIAFNTIIYKVQQKEQCCGKAIISLMTAQIRK